MKKETTTNGQVGAQIVVGEWTAHCVFRRTGRTDNWRKDKQKI